MPEKAPVLGCWGDRLWWMDAGRACTGSVLPRELCALLDCQRWLMAPGSSVPIVATDLASLTMTFISSPVGRMASSPARNNERPAPHSASFRSFNECEEIFVATVSLGCGLAPLLASIDQGDALIVAGDGSPDGPAGRAVATAHGWCSGEFHAGLTYPAQG